jgi:anti-sigma factor RsiW
MRVLDMEIGAGRHFDDDEAERYSLGTISKDEQPALEEHLLICESCRRRVAESDQYVAAMRSAAAQM